MSTRSKLFVSLLSLLWIAHPAFAEELERSHGGTLACEGNHQFRRDGTEISFTVYNFRNFNEDATITIDSITIYAADGTVLKDMPATESFPEGFNAILEPHQTSTISTIDIFGNSEPSPTPFQTIVRWSAGARGLALEAHMARQDRGRNAVTGNLLEQRARALFPCLTIR